VQPAAADDIDEFDEVVGVGRDQLAALNRVPINVEGEVGIRKKLLSFVDRHAASLLSRFGRSS